MNVLYWILLSTLLISLISFIGVLSLAVNKKLLNKVLLILVSLSAGALIGSAFIHLIPEALELSENIFLYVLGGFVLFFLIEKVLHWHHCLKGDCKVETLGYMNLIGDGIHNFIDGLIIAAAFVANIQLGIIASVAVALHEIPQEMGDFGVLIYSGFRRMKALAFNFLTALTAVVGGIIGYYLSNVGNSVVILLPIAAGGFIYIGASDLVPEIRKESNLKKSLINFVVFVIGILIMYGLK